MKVISIKERKDGSTDLKYSLDKKEEALFKEIAKKKGVKFSQKFCNKIVEDAIVNYIKEKK